MASTTSRMLYYTLVKRLNERDEKNKNPIAVAAPHHYDDPEKPKLKPIPDPIPNPKRRKPIEPPQFPHQLQQHQLTPLKPKNTIAIVKCKSTTKNAAANADLSYKKPLTAHGLCPSLKALDKRLNETFDSPEVTQAFEILRTKMEKEYVVKQLEKTRDNHMYFDDTDNYISAEDIRSKYKKICKSKEYLEAKKLLL
jgi:hypothetical protein